MSLKYDLLDRWAIEETDQVPFTDVLEYVEEKFQARHEELDRTVEQWEEDVSGPQEEANDRDEDIRHLKAHVAAAIRLVEVVDDSLGIQPIGEKEEQRLEEALSDYRRAVS